MDTKNPLGCWDREYLGKALGAAAVVLALSLGVKYFDLEQGTPLRYVIAAVQGVAFAYSVAITVGAIRRLDELVQRIHLEAIAISFTLTGIVVVTWSFLAKAGLPPVTWGPYTWLMMVLFWAGGVALRQRHYR